MARYGMMIDVDKCTGCYSCFLPVRMNSAGIIIRDIPLPSLPKAITG